MIDINVSLVGHTNVGKTSLLRTLTYNYNFGEVSFKASTTRHIEKTTLNFQDFNLNFFDTPGLEDASGLLDYLDDIPKINITNLERLNFFFKTKVSLDVFMQETKVLKQLLNSDLGLYVVDVREPFLAKYYDELVLLRDCAKPLLVVFNFLNEEKFLHIWEDKIKTLGIHKVIYFDAINPKNGEDSLYQSIAFLLPNYQSHINIATSYLKEQKNLKILKAIKFTSEMIVDCLSFKMNINENTEDLEKFKEIIRNREIKNINNILKVFHFPVNQSLSANKIFNHGRFENDLFSFEAIKTFTSEISQAFLKGVGGGFSIDLIFGWISLGTASLIGGTIGAVTKTITFYRDKIKNIFNDSKVVSVPDEIIIILITRSFCLIHEFSNIGHAHHIFNDNIFSKKTFDIKITEDMEKCRYHTNFSLLDKNNKNSDSREKFILKIQKQLTEEFKR